MGAFISSNSWRVGYDNVHVMVTGGSSGIGLEIAREYLRRGARVTIAARSQNRLDAAMSSLSETVPGSNGKIMSCSIDVSDSSEKLTAAFELAVEKFGPIEVLINCAGASKAAAFEDLSVKDFENLYRTNVLGAVLPTQFVLPEMKRRKRGRIVFISSQAAQVGIHGYSAYGASKVALRSLAEVLQMELRPYNIIVSVSYPPDTDTPGYKEEMLVKPPLCKALSESGTVFSAERVAKSVVDGSTVGCFNLSVGLDGWLLTQAHPGLAPINNAWEVIQGILFAGVARLISIFYLLDWDNQCAKYVQSLQPTNPSIHRKNE